MKHYQKIQQYFIKSIKIITFLTPNNLNKLDVTFFEPS